MAFDGDDEVMTAQIVEVSDEVRGPVPENPDRGFVGALALVGPEWSHDTISQPHSRVTTAGETLRE